MACNENIWKVVLKYAPPLDSQDLFSLRLTCKQAYREVTPLIQISTTRFNEFMKNIDSTGSGDGLDRWLSRQNYMTKPDFTI